MNRLGLCAALFVSFARIAHGQVVDDFEKPQLNASWGLVQGGDPFGGTATLSLAPGEGNGGSQALAVTYDFTGATYFLKGPALTLAQPADADAIRFWFRRPLGATVELRIDDSVKSALYGIHPPLWSLHSDQPVPMFVSMRFPSEIWNGPGPRTLAGPVKAFSLPIGPGDITRTRGTAYLDDVELLKAQPYVLDDTKPAQHPFESNMPLVRDIFGATLDLASSEVTLNAFQSSHLKWARVIVPWSSIETTSGIFDFKAVDQLATASAAHGFDIVWVLTGANPLHSDGPDASPNSPSSVAAFGAFAAAMAEHLLPLHASYEIWDGPDWTWRPALSASGYTTLAAEAIRRIRAMDAKAPVFVWAVDYIFFKKETAAGWPAGVTGTWLRSSNTPHEFVYRAYTQDLLKAASPQTSAFLFEEPVNAEPNEQESGAVSDERQAKRLMEAWLSGYAQSFKKISYSGFCGCSDTDKFKGLSVADGSTRLAVQAISYLMARIGDAKPDGLYEAMPSQLNVARFDNAGENVLVLWINPDEAETSVSIAPDADVRDIFGSAVSHDGALTISSDTGPLYVTLPAPQPAASPEDAAVHNVVRPLLGWGCSSGDVGGLWLSLLVLYRLGRSRRN